MKVSKLNSILLCLNLALLSFGCYFLWLQRGQAPVPEQTVSLEPLAEPPLSAESLAPQVVTITNDFRWRQLESEDYRTYIERLRSIGCPEETIRDIVISDLDKLMAPRLDATLGRRADLQFWHSEEEELANDRDQREVSRARRQIDKEKRAVIEELLGVDLVRERMRLHGETDYYERRMAFLPEARRSDVRKVLEKFDELEEQIRGKEWHDGEPLSAMDRLELRRLRAAQQAELAALLGPAELDQYELWMSDTANSVRRAAYGMDISKEEFLAIYNARKAFDAEWTGRDFELMDEATRQRMESARQQMEADLQRQLGAERFAEYKRGDDPEFHQLAKTATQFQLSRDTAQRAYEMKRSLEEISRTVEQNTALTPEQKTAALQAVHQETERAVRELLGEKAFRYYVRSGAPWLQAAR